MERCETCGNAYENSFHVVMKGETHVYDSFECAIQGLAPHCKMCDTRIIGHGLENGTDIYCCAGCARNDSVTLLKDHN